MLIWSSHSQAPLIQTLSPWCWGAMATVGVPVVRMVDDPVTGPFLGREKGDATPLFVWRSWCRHRVHTGRLSPAYSGDFLTETPTLV